ncbi:MAG TPA: hypothetical protein VG893_03655 [Terracidiphilus sp.]|nr:hypothetical protein [Terracidiphilus sp.]
MSHAVRTLPQPVAFAAAPLIVPVFALGMVGLGILALVYGDFAMGWQPVAQWVPGRTALAYGSGLLMLVCGIALFTRFSAWAARVLFVYLFLWMLLKVPALVVAPQIEGVWLGIGELAVLFTGGWALFARLASLRPDSAFAFLTVPAALRSAHTLFAASLVPIGLSHLLYVKETTALVPAWLPNRALWGDIAGIAQMLCGIAILLHIYPRIAAHIEAALIGLFTLLVWTPQILTAPAARLPWTAFFISWVIGASAWTLAQSIPASSRQG